MQIKREVMRGRRWVIDADIRGFFDALDPQILEQLVCERISDRRVLKLLRSWLRAGVLDGETLLRPEVGSPQGSPISPLLANVYLNALDRAWEDRHGGLGVLVRYCDDLVDLVSHAGRRPRPRMAQLRALLADLGLELADAKTRLVCVNNDGEGSFDFLGFHHRMVESFSKPGRSLPGPLAVGARHAGGAGEDPRAHRPAAVTAAGRGRGGRASTGFWPAGAATFAAATRRPSSTSSTATRSSAWAGSSANATASNVRSRTAAGWFASGATSACARSLDASITAPRMRPGEGCRCAV